jgi:hypothetical protein
MSNPKSTPKLNPQWVKETRVVKCKVKTYLAIHRLTLQYWDIIAEGLGLQPPSESQLRERLKKIGHDPGDPATFIF